MAGYRAGIEKYPQQPADQQAEKDKTDDSTSIFQD